MNRKQENRPWFNPKSDKVADMFRGAMVGTAEFGVLYAVDVFVLKSGVGSALAEKFVEAGRASLPEAVVALGVVGLATLSLAYLNAHWISWKFPKKFEGIK